MDIQQLPDINNKEDAYIPLSLPSRCVSETNFIFEAMQSRHRQGAGQFTARATDELKLMTGAEKILLTHSCTGALEMSMLLAEINVGDEVILPSYTFSSTANAVVLRGAIPVFADIDPLTQCIDAEAVSKLVTSKTRAIIPVHYAGVSCDMNALNQIAKDHGITIVEDAAQAVGASQNGKALGTFGELGAFSFHDSKNISCGEGGAILINDMKMAERAEILWEKGTNRSKFTRGEVDKYTWVDLGSSFLPSEITAAFLLGQLRRTSQINNHRLVIWNDYFQAFAEAESLGVCKRPSIPENCDHNAHIFYLMLNDQSSRNDLLTHLKSQGIGAAFHYVPLHSSPAGIRFGRTPLPMPHTDRAGSCLLRLPLFPDMTPYQKEKIINVTNEFLLSHHAKLTPSNGKLYA